jgi:glycerate dehydrogenase
VTAKLNIVVLDRDTFPAETIIRPPEADHVLRIYGKTSPDQVAERIADAHVVITNKAPITAAALAAAKQLKFISVAATGYDVIDVKACAAAGVKVSNIRNYALNTVPEHTFGLILALRRSLFPYAQSVAAGRWAESGQFCYFDFPVNDLAGSTLGIIGDGAIGQSVCKIAQAFGMRTLYSSYKGSTGMGPLYTPFEDVLRVSNIITVHSPLTASTRNMIGAPEFALMERRPLIINTARGGLVDEEALVTAMDSGQISGAGFDVATVEPLPADHPLSRLIGRPNFIVTPHVAWSSREAIQALSDQMINNIDAFTSGQSRNLVSV